MSSFETTLDEAGVGPATLGPAESRGLSEHGVAILRDVVDLPGLELLREAHQRLLSARTDRDAGRQGAARNVSLNPCDDPSLLPLFTHPRVLAAVHAVLRRPFRLFLLGGRHPARGHGLQGLHQDWLPRRPGEPARVVTVLWALDDFSAENGATRVLPGSHRLVRPLPKSLRQPHARHPDEMPVLPEAGSALVFDGHLWHAGGENRSGAARRSYQTQFVARDSAPPPELPDSLPDHLGTLGRTLLGAD